MSFWFIQNIQTTPPHPTLALLSFASTQRLRIKFRFSINSVVEHKFLKIEAIRLKAYFARILLDWNVESLLANPEPISMSCEERIMQWKPFLVVF